MIWIQNPILKPLVRPAALDDSQLAELTSRLTMRQCATLTELTVCEMRRRGFYRARIGGRFYCAIEARVATDVVRLELDLDEIAAQIEEAKFCRDFD